MRPKKPHWPFTMNKGCQQARRLKFWYAGDSLTGSGAMLDLAGSYNHGDLATNAGGVQPTWAKGAGKDGGDTVFLPGSIGNRVAPRRQFNITGNAPLTIAAWVYFTNAASAFEVICNFGADVIHQEPFLARSSTGLAYFEFGGGAGAATGTTTLAAKTWYHVCGVYTGAATFVYVNGRSEATTAYSSANIGNVQLSLGAYFNAGTFKLEMSGKLDDVRIYDRALPANEVWSLYDPETRWMLRWQPNRTARSFKFVAAAGGPWPHFGRRSRDLSGGMITIG